MEGKKVVKEMNDLQLIPILGLPPIMAVLSLGVSVMLGLLYSWAAALMIFAAVIGIGRWLFRTDSKFVELFFLSLSLGSEYDPAFWEDSLDYPCVD